MVSSTQLPLVLFKKILDAWNIFISIFFIFLEWMYASSWSFSQVKCCTWWYHANLAWQSSPLTAFTHTLSLHTPHLPSFFTRSNGWCCKKDVSENAWLILSQTCSLALSWISSNLNGAFDWSGLITKHFLLTSILPPIPFHSYAAFALKQMTTCTPYHRFIWKSKRISFNNNFGVRIVSLSFTMMALTFQLPSSINT